MDPLTWTLKRILETSGAYWATCAMRAAGFVDVERMDFAGPNDSGLVRGVKPV